MARMKAKIIISLSTIMLLVSLPLFFLPSMQTSSENDNDDCDSSYPDICIPSNSPELN
jgi:hypothetical protein